MSEIKVEHLPRRHIQIVRNILLKEGGKADWNSDWKPHTTNLGPLLWGAAHGPRLHQGDLKTFIPAPTCEPSLYEQNTSVMG